MCLAKVSWKKDRRKNTEARTSRHQTGLEGKNRGPKAFHASKIQSLDHMRVKDACWNGDEGGTRRVGPEVALWDQRALCLSLFLVTVQFYARTLLLMDLFLPACEYS